MDEIDLACRSDRRRAALFEQRDRFNGIDYVEVSKDQRSLCVHFFGEVPDGLSRENVRIEGGRRIRGIRVLDLEIDVSEEPDRDSCLRVTLDKPGDFSAYRLCLVERRQRDPDADSGGTSTHAAGEAQWQPYRGFDPRYACASFSFKIDCPSDLDCRTQHVCPPEARPAPEIDYLAKDYASFRQLVLDRLALTMPDWQERHAPDIGIALAELLAYAADHLSYYQDAVATEAYLHTARQRISVRRHARLVDYSLHEGLNARAWVTVHTDADTPPIKPADFYFITGFPEIRSSNGNIVVANDLRGVPASRYEVFEPATGAPDTSLTFHAAHSEIRLYTWGDAECCLPRGATRATLVDEGRPQVDPEGGFRAPQRALNLARGDVLIFEEAKGPRTGRPEDADPTHRHAVRLTAATPAFDALLGNRLVLEIEWAPQDALPFPLCISGRLPAPDCSHIGDISVARGNVVLVDHGRTQPGEDLGKVDHTESPGECACEGSLVEITLVPKKFTPPPLKGAPLTFSEPVAPLTPASELFARDPHRGLPQLSLTEEPVRAEHHDDRKWTWNAQPHLLGSAGSDRHFVVEVDDEGRAHLRFGDGELGMRPSPGMRFTASYRIGNGPAGNVGRESITHLVLRTASWSGGAVRPRNPMPAQGGTAPESVAEAKLLAPHAFRSRLLRAITADDYARIAERGEGIQAAAASLRWTGSWYEARVGVDPVLTEDAEAKLLDDVEGYLHPYRRIGHDLDVVRAKYVPLDIALRVCVLPHYARGEVKAALLDVLGNRALADGRRGLFHPDRLSFGGGIYLSQLVAAAQAVEGVESAEVTQLQRLGHAANGELESGVLPVDAMEIAQLDNDPDFPEHGRLTLTMGGGR